MIKTIKDIFSMLNKKYYYQSFKNTYQYIGRTTSLLRYLLYHFPLIILFGLFYYCLLNDFILSIILSYITSKIVINDYILNEKKEKFNYKLEKEKLLYMSKISLMIQDNNLYYIFKDATNEFEILKDDITNFISKKNSLYEVLKNLNVKYKDNYFNLFNNTLIEVIESGSDVSKSTLNDIYESANYRYIQKDDLNNFKLSYKKNYLTILITTISLPFFIKMMIPEIYNIFINNIGKYILAFLSLINVIYLSYFEKNYYGISFLEKGKKTNRIENQFIDFFQLLILLLNNNNVYQSLKKVKLYINKPIVDYTDELIENINIDKSSNPFINFSSKFQCINIKEIMILLYNFTNNEQNVNRLNILKNYIINISNNQIKIKIENYKNNSWKRLCLPIITTVLFIFSISIFIYYYFVSNIFI